MKQIIPGKTYLMHPESTEFYYSDNLIDIFKYPDGGVSEEYNNYRAVFDSFPNRKVKVRTMKLSYSGNWRIEVLNNLGISLTFFIEPDQLLPAVLNSPGEFGPPEVLP